MADGGLQTLTVPNAGPYAERDGPRRILAIDGGGMRGALAVGLLSELEAALRRKYKNDKLVLADYFDLIGGTSTGAIIAAGLALGKDTAYLRQLYWTLGPRVFSGGWLPRLTLIQSKFDPAKLEQVIREELGDVTLGTAAWRTGFAAVSKRVDTASCWVLSNCPHAKYWNGSSHSDTLPNRDYSLAKIVQASAAAPFYFDMVKIPVSEGDQGAFFDGAMTPHGNPSLQLAMSALIPGYGINWKPGAENLMIVSVGTGSPRPVKPDWAHERWSVSIWKAVHALTSLAYDNSQLSTSILQWLGVSPQGWPINGEIGDLSKSLPLGAAPLWTFVRYDAPLEVAWMKKHLGRTYRPEALHALAKLDDYRRVPELFEVGQSAGSILIKPEHFI